MLASLSLNLTKNLCSTSNLKRLNGSFFYFFFPHFCFERGLRWLSFLLVDSQCRARRGWGRTLPPESSACWNILRTQWRGSQHESCCWKHPTLFSMSAISQDGSLKDSVIDFTLKCCRGAGWSNQPTGGAAVPLQLSPRHAPSWSSPRGAVVCFPILSSMERVARPDVAITSGYLVVRLGGRRLGKEEATVW